MPGWTGCGGVYAERCHAPVSIERRLIDVKRLYFIEERDARFSAKDTATINHFVRSSRVLHGFPFLESVKQKDRQQEGARNPTPREGDWQSN